MSYLEGNQLKSPKTDLKLFLKLKNFLTKKIQKPNINVSENFPEIYLQNI